MEVKGFSSFSLEKKRTIPIRKVQEIREQTQGQVIPLWHFRTLEKKCPVYLKEKKESVHYFLVVEYLVVDFTIYGG